MVDRSSTDIVERLRHWCAPGDASLLTEAADEIERLRRALELLTEELPEEMHTLDEPDEDWEVIVKMRAIAREALSPSHHSLPPLRASQNNAERLPSSDAADGGGEAVSSEHGGGDA